MRLLELLDLDVLRRLTDANYRANGMPIGVVDAVDGSILVGVGWQDICVTYHRAHAVTAARCRESDEHIKRHLSPDAPCEYRCQNGLRDIGIPIVVAGTHLATLFMGQFFYEEEAPDRGSFADQARRFGFDQGSYLAALDRVPVFSRRTIENILVYNTALARFVSDVAGAALRERQATAAAKAQAVELEAILNCVGDGVIVYDGEGRTTRSTPSADRILGGAEDDRRAPIHERVLRHYELLSEDGRRLDPDELAAVRAAIGRETVVGQIVGLRRGEEETRWIRINARPLLVDGKHGGAVLSMSDVTDRKRDAESLREANARLREADRRKDEFLGMLSHELRNPLAPIRNSVYLLSRADPGTEQARRARGVIERQTEHLTRLVDDLLDVTRIARGKIQLRRARVDLREVVLRAADDFRLTLDDRGVALGVDLPHASVWADADPTRVNQVVGNLLHNATKFTRSGDEVAVSLRVVDRSAELRVRDTGAGIDPALLPRVFEPFVQGERTLARTEGGLGLGLALVKGIAELHGGSVCVESAGRGRGAEFIVRLPAVAAAAPHERAPATDGERGRGRRVLVVDDNADAAESLADVVKLLGHEVEVAFDGPAALERARASHPDVLLCDLGLPGIDGYEVARRLRAEGGRGMRLIAVSGYAQPEDVSRALEVGFDAHLAKPPPPEEIERLLS
jgi:signal transduction histidine kinase/CheY-like chemotaxis protein